MNVQTFFGILLRYWWLIILSVLLTAGSSAFFVSQQPRVYRATTTIELKASISLEDPGEVLGVINALTRRTTINTITRKATSSAMKKLIADRLGVEQYVIDDSNLTAIAVPDTNIIEIRAESTNREFARDICNTAAQLLLGQTLEKVLQMEIIDAATVPATPIAPQPARIISLALVFGLVLGIIFALLSHSLEQFSGPGGRFGDRTFKRSRGQQLASADVSIGPSSQASPNTPGKEAH